MGLFQSTLPRGERQKQNCSYGANCRISIHAPTRGATVQGRTNTKQITAFQSTLPRGERLNFFRYWLFSWDFNPRSHEGSDAEGRTTGNTVDIFQSTLPRGERPSPGHMEITRGDISIHAPTRGATIALSVFSVPVRNFNPRSHEGSDADWNKS